VFGPEDHRQMFDRIEAELLDDAIDNAFGQEGRETETLEYQLRAPLADHVLSAFLMAMDDAVESGDVIHAAMYQRLINRTLEQNDRLASDYEEAVRQQDQQPDIPEEMMGLVGMMGGGQAGFGDQHR
jgi:hypothetical protein